MEDRLASKSVNAAATSETHPDQGITAKPGSAHSATRQKYRAQRTVVDGINFASKAEAKRYLELRAMEQAGLIYHLELQPKFPVIINGIKVCTYIADFAYFTKSERITEDVKGMLTPVYRIKKKLVEALYPGMTITEIGRCSHRSSSRKSIARGPKPKAGPPTKS